MHAIKTGVHVLRTQGHALIRQADTLSASFSCAIDFMYATTGKVIVSGMGKSGIIGRKIAATLASTGTPSFFVHPGEAFHGDLGMIMANDCLLLISNSGETEEVLRLLPYLQHIRAKVIAITGKPESTLARQADLSLPIPVERESCPNNLAPTTSTTLALAMGDALAVALMEKRQFQAEDFARFHPGGSLGRKLLTKTKDAMHARVPFNLPDDTFTTVVSTITEGCLGLSVVGAPGAPAVGIITDGDLRRAIEQHEDLKSLSARDIMSPSPFCIAASALLSDAEALMNQRKITALLVTDERRRTVGIIKSFDI
ncbi:arabinose 5-phosphate isomerase [Chromobacterium sp. LK11]|nr:arabinose 5-phosphate isomerase [Chromobacterium sp. LK11]